ncbi:uncharacterized protein IWZ02DRAFT_263303 [Phyllosticta citriasiana]|uniref:uncharacterized protein n=1 Tax=Phyllosticta citriasiana TaxID=595635 RepID=UPI0030FD859C
MCELACLRSGRCCGDVERAESQMQIERVRTQGSTVSIFCPTTPPPLTHRHSANQLATSFLMHRSGAGGLETAAIIARAPMSASHRSLARSADSKTSTSTSSSSFCYFFPFLPSSVFGSVGLDLFQEGTLRARTHTVGNRQQETRNISATRGGSLFFFFFFFFFFSFFFFFLLSLLLLLSTSIHIQPF